MRGRRKRRFRGTWLPNLGTQSAIAGAWQSLGRTITMAAYNGTDRSGVGAVIPLVYDTPQEAFDFAEDEGLNTFVANEYALRRVVGKFFASYYSGFNRDAANIATYTPSIVLTAGLFVARAGDSSDSLGNAAPVGDASQATIRRDYGVDSVNCGREPWIWRRKWILACSGLKIFAQAQEGAAGTVDFDAVSVAAAYPTSTAEYGSVLDGPHVDAKTRRRVGNDDRLWLSVWAAGFPPGFPAAPDVEGRIDIHFDYRVFAALRRARNRGAF